MKCLSCPYSTTNKRNFQVHILTHFGKILANFVCPVCAAKFITATELKVHMNALKNILQYRCPKCKRKFNQTGNMKRHKCQKDGKGAGAKVGCRECGKVLNDKNRQHLLRHLNQHFLFHYFQCTTCKYRSTDSSLVRRHRKTHSGKVLTCSKCGAIFNEKRSLREPFFIITSTETASNARNARRLSGRQTP